MKVRALVSLAVAMLFSACGDPNATTAGPMTSVTDEEARAVLQALVGRSVSYFEEYPNPQSVLALPEFRRVYDSPQPYVEAALAMLREPERTEDERAAITLAMHGLRGQQLVHFAREALVMLEQGQISESDYLYLIFPPSDFGADLTDGSADAEALFEQIEISPRVSRGFKEEVRRGLAARSVWSLTLAKARRVLGI